MRVFKKKSRNTFILFILTSSFCFGQYKFQFKKLQEDFASQNWNLTVNGIFLKEDVSFTASQFEFVGAEAGLIEVPLLLKIKVTDKLSLLSGAKLDFYRLENGISTDVGVSISSGLQYDFIENAFLRAGFNYQLNNSGSHYNYNFGNRSSLFFKYGIKF
ncbi:hypothetical protein [uncultured Winogradskyella sp.]|uniref:hypothetical protein n=1 Tax=uncultured Winogradskyella sp. TaxID=395353 RepID=UPI0026349819|nr:hypothetical protein [uncultured Winogradskyella sp.]